MRLENNVKVGDLYQVCTEDFWCTTNKNQIGEDDFGRNTKYTINFKLGEIIEIRYAYEWHIRTVDNVYMHVDPSELELNCKPFGRIHSDVSFSNGKNLKEILDEKLYDKAIFCVSVKEGA